MHTRTEPPAQHVTHEPTQFESFVAARSAVLFGTAVLLAPFP